jgi:hypothetical protein
MACNGMRRCSHFCTDMAGCVRRWLGPASWLASFFGVAGCETWKMGRGALGDHWECRINRIISLMDFLDQERCAMGYDGMGRRVWLLVRRAVMCEGLARVDYFSRVLVTITLRCSTFVSC